MIKFVELNSEGYILRGLHHEVKDAKGLLVLFHGFTGSIIENGFFFKTLCEELAKHNIATLRFDFMGSGMSDGHFNEMDFTTELKDFHNIMKYAVANKGDKELYVLGFSFGGAVAGYGVSEYNEEVDKLVLCAPAGNMRETTKAGLDNPNANWYDKENIDMGGYLINKKFVEKFQDVDLYQNIEHFTKPTIIVHGELDQVVPIEYGKKYQEKLKDCTFVEIPGSAHSYTTMKHRTQVIDNIVNFLK